MTLNSNIMLIQYFGLSCFRLTTKQTQDVSLVIDPFNPKSVGLKASRLKAQLALTTAPGSLEADHTDLVNPAIKKPVEHITTPGEYEIAGIFIQAIPSTVAGQLGNLFYVEIEGITFGFLGNLSETSLNDTQLEVIEGLDVLTIPAGSSLDPKQVKAVISQVEPRVVFPTHFKLPGLKLKRSPLETCLKELGSKHVAEVSSKLKLTKKDLSSKDRRVCVIRP